MTWALGIDIGGTNLVVGAVSADGTRVVGVHSRPTLAARGAEAILAELVAMGQATLAILATEEPDARVIGVGAGAPGPLDTRTGVVRLTPNLGWIDYPLAERLRAGFDLPSFIDNDANCAILAEQWLGAARGARCVVGMTIGTGIGGGIVLDGRLHRGVADAAGEIGHMTIVLDGRPCGCGNHGCLEAYASGSAIARRAAEALQEPGRRSALAGFGAAPTAQDVFAAARAGDPLAGDIVRETATYLGVGLASLLNVFNPDVVVIVGGVTGAADLFFPALREEIARRAFAPAVAACEIRAGELDGKAGLIGAARVAFERLGTWSA